MRCHPLLLLLVGAHALSRQPCVWPCTGKTSTEDDRFNVIHAASVHSNAVVDATYDEETLSEYQRNHGWFIAFAPVEAPQIAIAVLTENSGGGSSAYPVARSMLDYWMARHEQ